MSLGGTGMITMSRKLLVLDLDSTLIYSSPVKTACDFEIVVKGYRFYVKLRPGIEAFLAFIKDHFDVAVWSAAHKLYVAEIVKVLFKDFPLVFVYSGERCTEKIIHDEWKGGGLDGEHVVLKKLKKVWDRKTWTWSRKDTLILDDDPETYMQNYGNSVPIKPYTGQTTDGEFKRVMNILESARAFSDVRIAYKR